ncbi:MAG TPA: hypothetical protein VML50_11040 [Anaeromyxobacter sp.]|nr:hypothetical protein [Anaeromyxobacter sp.]
MKPDSESVARIPPHDFVLPGGCLLCGGDLDVRMTAGGAASYCKACRWMSRPHLRREDGQVQVIHPAGGVA